MPTADRHLEHDDAAGPRVSVIIPVHGDRGRLARTLERLREQDFEDRFEVLVVDNGDNGDLNRTVLSFPGARVLHEPQPGSYAARNTGVAAARGAVLAFTDADCLPTAQWLSCGVEALERSGPGSFAGGAVRMVLEHEEPAGPAELWQLGNDLRQEVYVRERGWAATANLLVRAEDLRRVGLFDQAAESGGDREWGERASAVGLRAVYARDAVVLHPARGTMAQLTRKITRVTRGAVHRQLHHGVPVFPRGLHRALLAGVRSSWHRSGQLEVNSRRLPLGGRLQYTAVCMWIQVLRTVYAGWLLSSVRRSVTSARSARHS